MDPGLRHKLTEVFDHGPSARFVAVFGSQVTGASRDDSDIDVAWLPADTQVTLSRELDLQARLTRVAACDVDLVRVDLTSTICRMEIARHGELIHGDHGAWVSFRAQAIAEFLDFEPALRDATRRFAAQLRRQGGGGAA